MQRLPHLPEELWLEILHRLDWTTLWRSMRAVHPIFRAEAERTATSSLLPQFSMALTYSLSSSRAHRWYDVRATITLSYKTINKHNPEFAGFEISSTHPSNYHERALEKWRLICAQGLNPELEWRLSCSDTTHKLRLAKVIPAEYGALWCDWRELLNAYFRTEADIAESRDNVPQWY